MLDAISSFNNFAIVLSSLMLIVFFDVILTRIYEVLIRDRINISRAIRAIIFWIYVISIQILILALNLIDAGLLNDIKTSFIYLFALLIFGTNLIKFIGENQFNRRRYFRANIHFTIIWVLLFFTVAISQGFYFSAEDQHPEWTPKISSYVFENTTYNISVQVTTVVSSYQGFFIKSPITLTITEGFVKYTNESIPRNSTIKVKLKLTPHAYFKDNNTYIRDLTTIDTEFDGNETYNIDTKDKSWLLYYIYSGTKYVSAIVNINGTDVVTMEQNFLMEIEKGHIKSQVESSRAVVILTLWIIYLTIFRPLDELIDWIYDLIHGFHFHYR